MTVDRAPLRECVNRQKKSRSPRALSKGEGNRDDAPGQCESVAYFSRSQIPPCAGVETRVIPIKRLSAVYSRWQPDSFVACAGWILEDF